MMIKLLVILVSEETLLQCTDLASCVRLLKPEHLTTGLELIRRIQERLVAILQHSTQDFRVGYQSKTGPDQETAQASNLANHTDTNKESKSDGDSDNNNCAGEDPGDEAEEDDEYDDEYVPEWHEDYDEEDIDDDDFFSDDDESENLERDFSPLD
ncbi:cullin-9-like [Sinocyclocheilus rhinocerous]|uniref:cullin-9-like n=1 Tax=Sinocyclocheilus rhinocerous TaxID=307959 RepID=UPI0007B7EA82|nr:PREDICTED: cullin-9-like [Sinocyclocheilus rhinocerous]